MEITWNLITNSEKGFNYERIFGDYEKYFNGEWAEAVIYREAGQEQLYVRAESEFNLKFKQTC